LLICLIIYDVVRSQIKDRFKFKQVYGDDESYFSRLGQMDRLRMLVFESFIRREYGVKTMDDTAFDAILNAKNASQYISVEPPNFNILANPTYQRKVGFCPIHMQKK